jgi:hypothetical protein
LRLNIFASGSANKMKKFFVCLIFGIGLFLGGQSQAFLPFFQESPCGCGRLKAGADIARMHRSPLEAEANFKQCLQCRETKQASDILPYIKSFLRQLPQDQYDEYASLLHKLSYDGVLGSADTNDKRLRNFLEVLKRHAPQNSGSVPTFVAPMSNRPQAGA